MNTIIAVLNEKVFVETHAAIRVGFKLDHPTAYSIRIELLVPRGIKRVGEIDPFAVPAHFHHLRATRQRLVRVFRMRSTIHDPTNPHRTGLLWIEWIGYVVL